MARGQKKEKKELTLEERLQQALVSKEEWPYELPKEWKWVRLGSVCTFIGGGTPSKSNSSYWDGDIPWASVKDIKGQYLESTQDFITENGLNNSATNLCEPGDLLLITRIEPGKTAIAKIRCAINQDLKIVKSDLNARYLNYYFQNFMHWFEQRASGSTVKGITIKNVEQMQFPLAPADVQKRISDFIDCEFSELDEAEDQIQSILDSSEERKQSILHKAFTGELTEKWRKENGHSLDEWESLRLDDCGEWYGGGTPATSHPEYFENADLLWITSKDMKSDFINDTQIKINLVGIDNSSAKLISDPAILFVMRSGILRHNLPIAVVNVPFSVNQDIKALVAKTGILPEYIMYACKAKELHIRNTCMKSGTTVESLEFNRLKKIKIDIPSSEEQQEIVRLVKQYLNKEQTVKDSINSVLDQLETARKSILSKAFRGELIR